MDLLTDNFIWLVESVSDLVLWAGRRFFSAITWILDRTSGLIVGGLRLTSRLLEWSIENPWQAALNVAIAIGIILLILAIEIYIYDLLKRRSSRSGE